MSYELKAFLSTNITLVYDRLPLENIDRNALRNILGTTKVLLMDSPEMIVALAPPSKIVLQLGDRRIRITDSDNKPADKSGIWSMALQAIKLVLTSKLVAYGFNYDVGIKWCGSQPVREFLKKRFLPNAPEIAKLVEGEIQIPVPRIMFTRGKTLYDLLLEPIDEQDIKIHINAHFQRNVFPNEKELQKSFVTEFNVFLNILGKLLRE